jgi:catechol 2,3-dioxygenase-like lactoylglutathione lyase family enzyme
MDLKLEVVVIPVTDVDRAKKFYGETLGWRVDIDFERPIAPGKKMRGVQLTPPGSQCSIHIGSGITDAKPGSYQNTYLVTSDIEATRAELTKRGVELSEPFHFGPEGITPGLEPNRGTYNSFVSFKDPDGNSWFIQEITQRFPGR